MQRVIIWTSRIAAVLAMLYAVDVCAALDGHGGSLVRGLAITGAIGLAVFACIVFACTLIPVAPRVKGSASPPNAMRDDSAALPRCGDCSVQPGRFYCVTHDHPVCHSCATQHASLKCIVRSYASIVAERMIPKGGAIGEQQIQQRHDG